MASESAWCDAPCEGTKTNAGAFFVLLLSVANFICNFFVTTVSFKRKKILINWGCYAIIHLLK